MKRFSERLLLGSILGLGVVFATSSCSSSSDSNPPAGSGNSGNSTGNGTSGSGNHAGNGSVGTGGNGSVGTAGNGSVGAAGTGAGTTGGNGSVGTAGGTGTAGAGTAGGGAVATCVVDPDLLKAAADSCFVGCDPTVSTDNPDGIQGAFYTFGDGSSCTVTNPPCSSMGVCLSGATVVDKTYAKWGCGLGLELNSSGGTPSVKSAYAGDASCFNYTLTGNSGGNEVRIAFTQTADTTNRISPYVSIPAFTNGKTGTVCLKDVTCQGADPTKCALTGMAFDFQVNVVGGNNAGNYNVCLSSLTPVTSGTSTLSQVCGAQGASNATEDVGKYFVQNNVNANHGSLCVTPALNGSNASFKIDTASLSGGGLAAYPSLVDGWHYGRKSTDTALPKLVSSLQSVQSSVTYTNPNGGTWDASYDIWVLPSSANAADPSGGLEVMLWLNDSNVNPAGSNTNNPYMGWEVWNGQVGSWKYVAYRKTGQSTFTGDLAPFIKNAVSVSGLGGTPYLAGIEFGYEAYDNSVQGQGVSSFSVNVQ